MKRRAVQILQILKLIIKIIIIISRRRAWYIHQFTPLVFTTTGSMGREGTTFYKRLADMLSHKQEKPYSVVMGWLRCRLSFAILRSSIMCLRGTRSSFGHPVNEVNLTLACAEGQVPSENYH